MNGEAKNLAEVGYSKETRRTEVVVPRGTKVAELAKAIEFLTRDVLSKLPRGCTNCISGDHLIIRERLDPVIRVNLDQKSIVK
jgi:hypothetical protein